MEVLNPEPELGAFFWGGKGGGFSLTKAVSIQQKDCCGFLHFR